jgi:hypothetical protein
LPGSTSTSKASSRAAGADAAAAGSFCRGLVDPPADARSDRHAGEAGRHRDPARRALSHRRRVRDCGARLGQDGAVEQGGRFRLRQTFVRSHLGFVAAHQIVEFLVFHAEDLKPARSFSRA